MAEFTPMYKRTGQLRTGITTNGADMDTESEKMVKESKEVRSQVPQTRERTNRPKGLREQKGASAKKVPENYVADLNEISEELYKKLLKAYKHLDQKEMVHLPDETFALHKLIVRDTETYYEEVMDYLKKHQVPGIVAKRLKRKAKGFENKSQKRSVKYATDTQTRNWSASPQAFSDFKKIYVDFYKHLINSHLKATPEEQKDEKELAHLEKGNKLTEFFNTHPELKKSRLDRVEPLAHEPSPV